MIDSETFLKIETKMFKILSTDDEIYNANMRKKLISLIDKVSEYILRNIDQRIDVLIKGLCEYILRKGARYLRQDSIQIIRLFINETSLEIINNDNYIGILLLIQTMYIKI
jgi:hypothetical protein